MTLLVALVVAVIWLDAPWNWILVAAAIGLEVGEASLLWWLSRRRRPAVGVEAMVGTRATVVTPTQVLVHGELWQARSDDALRPGDEVRVVAVDGLAVVVART